MRRATIETHMCFECGSSITMFMPNHVEHQRLANSSRVHRHFSQTWTHMILYPTHTFQWDSRPQRATTIRYAIIRNYETLIHGANMGPNWVLTCPGGLHIGPTKLAIWELDRWVFLGGNFESHADWCSSNKKRKSWNMAVSYRNAFRWISVKLKYPSPPYQTFTPTDN